MRKTIKILLSIVLISAIVLVILYLSVDTNLLKGVISSQYSTCVSKIQKTYFNKERVYLYKNEGFVQYFDMDLYPDSTLAIKHICKSVSLNLKSYRFLVTNLGFKPTTFNDVYLYRPYEEPISYYLSSTHTINNIHNSKITNTQINSLSYGNTHEFVHAFFGNTNVTRSWFEEGLADYIEHTQSNGRQVGASTGTSSNLLYCRNDFWEEGYINSSGEFVLYERVSYSDFSVAPADGVDFYNPLRRSSYYRSGECFWAYIEETYGNAVLQQISQKWNAYRDYSRPEKNLIRDIVNPTVPEDITILTSERYNYTY